MKTFKYDKQQTQSTSLNYRYSFFYSNNYIFSPRQLPAAFLLNPAFGIFKTLWHVICVSSNKRRPVHKSKKHQYSLIETVLCFTFVTFVNKKMEHRKLGHSTLNW